MSDQQEETQETPFAKPAAKKTAKKADKKVEVKTKTTDLTKLEVVVVNADGSDSDQNLEVIKTTGSSIILKEVVPDIKTIKIDGLDIQLDLNKLRKMSPNDKLHGKVVSLLIAAAELA